VTARELGEHIRNATEALGLKYQEQFLVQFTVETVTALPDQQITYLVFSYENVQYRVRI